MWRLNTHIWIIIYSWDQVVDEGLQGPRHQVVVMVIEAWVALFLGLVQVLVVAAGVQLPRERWCLRHVVLEGDNTGRVSQDQQQHLNISSSHADAGSHQTNLK